MKEKGIAPLVVVAIIVTAAVTIGAGAYVATCSTILMTDLTTEQIIIVIGIIVTAAVSFSLLFIKRWWAKRDYIRHKIDDILTNANSPKISPRKLSEKLAHYGKPAIRPLRDWFRALNANNMNTKRAVSIALEKLSGDVEAKKFLEKYGEIDRSQISIPFSKYGKKPRELS